MKINDLYKKQIDTNIYKPKENKNTKASPKNEKDVKVEISSPGKALAKEISKVSDKSYSERVEKIRQSILNGSYSVYPEDIAGKILQVMENQKKGSGEV